MEAKTVKQLRTSEVYRIIAAVLEVMEKAQFEPMTNVTLDEGSTPEKWKMDFLKKSTTLDELNSIKNELGTHFSVTIISRDKSLLVVSIEAPSEDFKALLKRKPAFAPSKSVFENPISTVSPT